MKRNGRGYFSYFGVKEQEAETMIKQQRAIISSWKAKATRLGIQKEEREQMAPAFNLLF